METWVVYELYNAREYAEKSYQPLFKLVAKESCYSKIDEKAS